MSCPSAQTDGLVLFTGLNAIPKKSPLSECCHCSDCRRTLRVLGAWQDPLARGALNSGDFLNLGVHSIPYGGGHPVVEKHFVAMRFRRQARLFLRDLIDMPATVKVTPAKITVTSVRLSIVTASSFLRRPPTVPWWGGAKLAFKVGVFRGVESQARRLRSVLASRPSTQIRSVPSYRMESTIPFYREPLGLLTDLYQLTMAYGYWKSGTATREAVFHLHFRKAPFAGGYAIACGLSAAVEWLSSLRFTPDDLAYLATLVGNDGAPLFEQGFLEHLGALHFSCDVDAIPEGTAVFAHEPLLRVQGPLVECQLVETALLDIVNFQTLIATKAARVCAAAAGDPVLEFGLRRAQGIDGALSASRAAFVGGCAATSNVLAGRLFGIPVRGTHAHSWVMSYGDEREAFMAYARAMPNNCVFLVDTYDTLQGVRHAIEVGRWLRAEGHDLAGVRLDSGDLAYLSIEARKLLDDAGFSKTAIVASNDLDERLIMSLKAQGAAIGVWGVGTKLVTAYDQPALGGVYKLAAIREADQPWQYRIKLSEQAVKISTPGVQQVRRFLRDGVFVADMIYDTCDPSPTRTLVDPLDATRRRSFEADMPYEDLLVPVFRRGARVASMPSAHEARARTLSQLASLHAGVRRFEHPHQYPVGIEGNLHDLRTRLIVAARAEAAR